MHSKWPKLVLTCLCGPHCATTKIANVLIVFSYGQIDTEAVGRSLEQVFPNQSYWSAGLALLLKKLQFVRDDHNRVAVDQQSYAQRFCSGGALVLKLRYGKIPANFDIGPADIDPTNVDRFLDLTAKGHC